MGILVVYMYGAMCLKYVAGAQSLYQGISFLAYGDIETLEDNNPWVYEISILFFGFLCCVFSFGDIENSKALQIFSAWMRIIVLLLMYIGTFYYMGDSGTSIGPIWDWDTQKDSLATVFGNTVFIFIYHHSIPGIMYPIRPQNQVGRMFITSHIAAVFLLLLEGYLAFIVFSGLPNKCTDKNATYPC